jgi:hypothetical protein
MKDVEGAFCEPLCLTRPEGLSNMPRMKIPQMREAQYHPLWLHGGRRYIGHEVEASTPILRKTGTREGRASQWCNRLPR